MDPATSLATYSIPEETLPIVSGYFAFAITLALSTSAQKLVGISTATKAVPSVLGMTTVCLASLASQRAAVGYHEWKKDHNFLRNRVKRNRVLALSPSVREYWEIGEQIKIPLHDLRICILGMLSFKLLGGRFWAIAPSSFTHLGSFSRWSIPCTERYATTSQRAMMERMGKLWGCHTCGSHMLFTPGRSFKFVGDHMPPKSIAEQVNRSFLRRWGILPKVQFRFYPQCVNCSQTQGSILSKASSELSSKMMPSFQKAAKMLEAGGGTLAHNHGFRFRINHLAGAILGGATVVGATDQEIANGNPKRLENVQRQIHEFVKKNTR